MNDVQFKKTQCNQRTFKDSLETEDVTHFVYFPSKGEKGREREETYVARQKSPHEIDNFIYTKTTLKDFN